MPLFDLSRDSELPESSRRHLIQASQHLRHLRLVLESLVNSSKSGPASQEGMIDLETKASVCRLVGRYLDAVLWFLAAGLLPEVGEPAAEVSKIQLLLSERQRSPISLARKRRLPVGT